MVVVVLFRTDLRVDGYQLNTQLVLFLKKASVLGICECKKGLFF